MSTADPRKELERLVDDLTPGSWAESDPGRWYLAAPGWSGPAWDKYVAKVWPDGTWEAVNSGASTDVEAAKAAAYADYMQNWPVPVPRGTLSALRDALATAERERDALRAANARMRKVLEALAEDAPLADNVSDVLRGVARVLGMPNPCGIDELSAAIHAMLADAPADIGTPAEAPAAAPPIGYAPTSNTVTTECVRVLPVAPAEVPRPRQSVRSGPEASCWRCDGERRFEGHICSGCGSVADGRGGSFAPEVTVGVDEDEPADDDEVTRG